MTCIVGVATKDGSVYLGGDSAGAAGWEIRIRADEKVFVNGQFVFGFTSSFRMGQLLRYKLHPPEQPDKMPDHEYMATLFIDAVRGCLKGGGFAKKDNEAEEGGSFLVGYHGKVYEIGSDYQVAINADGYAAVGCGAQIALGAMYTTPDGDPETRLLTALAAAERFSNGVRGPFTVVGIDQGG